MPISRPRSSTRRPWGARCSRGRSRAWAARCRWSARGRTTLREASAWDVRSWRSRSRAPCGARASCASDSRRSAISTSSATTPISHGSAPGSSTSSSRNSSKPSTRRRWPTRQSCSPTLQRWVSACPTAWTPGRAPASPMRSACCSTATARSPPARTAWARCSARTSGSGFPPVSPARARRRAVARSRARATSRPRSRSSSADAWRGPRSTPSGTSHSRATATRCCSRAGSPTWPSGVPGARPCTR